MKHLLLLLALLGATNARAQDPADALPRFVRTIYDEAQKRESEGDLRGAEIRYDKVYEMQPSWTNVLQDIGRVCLAQDDVAGAIRAYQRAPFEADAVESLARLYLADEKYEEAAALFSELRTLRQETAEFLPLEAAAKLHYDPVDAEIVFREYLAKIDADLENPEIQQIALDVVIALYDAAIREKDEENEEASARLEDLASILLANLVDLLEQIEIDEEDDNTVYEAIVSFSEVRGYEKRAEERLGSAGMPLTPDQLLDLNRARAAFAENKLDEAAAILDEILLENRSNAATWAALSAVREEEGRIAEAEQAIVLAEELEPANALYPARLGAILATHYGGRFDGDAAKAIRRALQRPGSSPHLWHELARLEERGNRSGEASIRALERFLELSPHSEGAAAARAQLEDLTRERPVELSAPTVAIPPEMTEKEWFQLHLAMVYLDEATGRDEADEDRGGLLDAALQNVALARMGAPDHVRAINLEAQIRVERGELEDAVALWERSLELDPNQAAVVLDMAGVHHTLGNREKRDVLLLRAEELGDPESVLRRARVQAAQKEWWAARDTLERYFAKTPPGSPSYSGAVELQDRVGKQILGRYVGWGVLVTGVLVAPILLRWYRNSGVGVSQLLRHSPAAYRDVARICSAIRHEVLKHNTTVLVSVADAMDDGDPEPAHWAAEKLYGKRGAVARFREYIDELELLGRVHGVGLNLRRCDDLFGPIIDAVDRLSRLERDFRGTPGRRTAADLREISETLNETGYRGLGKLLQRVCLLELSDGLLRQIFDEVRREPAFADVREMELTVSLPTEGILLRIFQTDLEDILTNLLRNSLIVSQEIGAERVGILVSTEEDDITGLERVAIRVADDGPRRISTAMIRGRYISRGLGLAVDLISRNAGSIHVEDEEEWSKAVVVRLPRAEASDEG